ncbi:hypothetical protein SCP_0606100 [Sparassis crispa]|uniref:Uncharacterized protein n=1 Tax=Sparassis crispa TaxID=139825 RepID=A0A401GQV2_9APHY|nr:hypothetical protein SCP_0606100 [Sparassis crispa]GBE84631.1 hypothetical protein SCP_0606100 [Sparassis crispa]
MYIGKNCASQAARYINSQLAALYENAVECLDTHGCAANMDDECRSSYALAEYSDFGQSRSKKLKDRVFHAVFNQPHVDFICNHAAILCLSIRYGFYCIENVFSAHQQPVTISDVNVKFCISFDRERHILPASESRRSLNAIQLVILDFMNAQLVSATADVAIDGSILESHLARYLRFLQDAGSNIFPSLPEFDARKPNLTIDFSLFGSAFFRLGRHKIGNVSVKEINNYLASTWFKASTLDAERNIDSDWRATSLADLNSVRALPAISNVHFQLSFDPPRLNLICSREAVVTFRLSDVKFFDTPSLEGPPKRQYGACDIVVLFDIYHEIEGHIVRCKLDINSARIVNDACKLPYVDDGDETAIEYWTGLLKFFVPGYVEILKSANYHVVYYDDERVHASAAGEGRSPLPSSPATQVSFAWKQALTDTDLHGFDQVIVVSQSSANAHLYDLYSRSLKDPDLEWLSDWGTDDFHARVQPMTCCLLSNNKAIVWVDLAVGNLKMPDQEYEFEDLRLAFELTLKMFTHDNLFLSRNGLRIFENSLAYKDHCLDGAYEFRHICLDFTSCKFLHEYSRFESVFEHCDRNTIDVARAIINNIQKQYFSVFTTEGLGVIHTLPIWAGDALQDRPAHVLTDVAFYVHSESTVDRQNWMEVSEFLAPVIVVLGMCNFRRLPFRYLDLPPSWHALANEQGSHGILAIDRTVFLEDWLLKSLAYVNRATTLIPEFSRPKDGSWEPEMIPWATHCFKKDHPCRWQLRSEQDGFLRFAWKNLDGWNYGHESGPTDSMNGSYAISCGTRNYLEIPSLGPQKELNIKIRGEIELRLSCNSSRTHWSVKSSAKWDIVLVIVTESSGLHFELQTRSAMFDFARNEIEGDTTAVADAKALLKECLQDSLDFTTMMDQLWPLEGIWQSCYPGSLGFTLAHPGFSTQGDVLLKLRPFGQLSSADHTAPGSRQALTICSRRRSQSSCTVSPRSSPSRHLPSLPSPGCPPSLSPPASRLFGALSPPSQRFVRPSARDVEQARAMFAYAVAITNGASTDSNNLSEPGHIDVSESHS